MRKTMHYVRENHCRIAAEGPGARLSQQRWPGWRTAVVATRLARPADRDNLFSATPALPVVALLVCAAGTCTHCTFLPLSAAFFGACGISERSIHAIDQWCIGMGGTCASAQVGSDD